MRTPQLLIEKYNQAVPRYTSYPPANFFRPISSDSYRDMLIASNTQAPQNISLYFHIPFCSQLCHFCGCNTKHSQDTQEMRSYVEALKKEMQLIANIMDSNRQVSQIHWGGGTPNSLPIGMVAELMRSCHQLFSIAPQAEIAIECHPALLSHDYIRQLVDMGFNRFSIGIQDFNDQVLKNVNRAPSAIPMAQMMSHFRSYPHIKVNFDFVYGLPYQTVDSFANTIKQAMALQPDRLVTFSYAHVPWIKKAQKILEKKGLPAANEKIMLFETAYDMLTQAGYHAIGLDHFAKAQDELYIALQNKQLHRNFQGYCTRQSTGQVYAFGVTGISQMANGYAQNTKDIATYIATIESGHFAVEKGYQLSQDEAIVRQAINEIMCNGYLSITQLAQQMASSTEHIIKVLAYTPERFAPFEKDGILTTDDNSLTLTDMGRFFVRLVAAELDPVFAQTHKGFSRAL